MKLARFSPSAGSSDSQASPVPLEDSYDGYLIKFKPQPTPDGRYLAFAIVSSAFHTPHTLAALTPDLPSFQSQAAAANAGWEAATRWIDRRTAGDAARTANRLASGQPKQPLRQPSRPERR